MIARGIALLGFILVVLGVLKLVGVAIGIATAAATTLLIVGIILILIAWYVFGAAGRRTPL